MISLSKSSHDSWSVLPTAHCNSDTVVHPIAIASRHACCSLAGSIDCASLGSCHGCVADASSDVPWVCRGGCRGRGWADGATGARIAGEG